MVSATGRRTLTDGLRTRGNEAVGHLEVLRDVHLGGEEVVTRAGREGEQLGIGPRKRHPQYPSCVILDALFSDLLNGYQSQGE